MDPVHRRIEEVYRNQSPRMWRALLGFTGDPEVATDAMAESFARALREGDAIRDVAAWTWRVAFRLAAAELRGRRDSPSGWAPTSYEMAEPVPELLAALKRLSPKQRLAVMLHDYADRPTSEVAQALGCSRATVYVHLSQGRRRLQSLLEDAR